MSDLLSLHHLALGALNVETLARFYQNVFGLSEVARHTDEAGALRSVWLSLSPGVLMIEQTHPDLRGEALPAAVVPGFFLLAFRTPDLRLAEQGLARNGIPVESRTSLTLYFRDPEKNRVALSQYPLPLENVT